MPLSNSFLPAAVYNSLPHISANADVPTEHVQDLTDLRQLLAKYNVPPTVGIRLIHTHFNALDGEIMVIRPVELPAYGSVEIMQPTKDFDPTKTHPIHYFVDEDGTLKPYEYSSVKSNIPCYDGFDGFLDEFSNIIVTRGLQHRFGLKIDCEDEVSDSSAKKVQVTSWTEFEYPERRGTILLEAGMPIPEGSFDKQVTTEWYGAPLPQKFCHHVTCTHCRNHRRVDADVRKCIVDGVFSFGGQPVSSQTAFHGLLTQVVEAW